MSERCVCCHAPDARTIVRRDDGCWFDDDGNWRDASSGRAIGTASSPALNPHFLESVGRAGAERVVLEHGVCAPCRARIARAKRKPVLPLTHGLFKGGTT